MPYFNYGGVLADSSDVVRLLLESGAKYCEKNGVEYLEVRCLSSFNSWPKKSDKVSMIKKLPASQNALDADLGAKLRSQIKKASHYGDFVFKVGSIELLESFYAVFSENMRDLGTPVYGKDFFSWIFKVFSQNATIAVLYMNGEPVSAGILIGYREVLEIPWASTLKKANAFNANMFFYRSVLRFAIDRSYKYFDFGRSTMGSNAYRFKKQWGAKPVTHYWHYWLSGDVDEIPALNPENKKYRLAINCWKRLPLWLSNLLGPHIVKNLP